MPITPDLVSQIGITCFGLTAVFLLARKSKWGVVFGLLSQPFWFTTAFLHQQWGIMLLSTVYASMWIYGIYNWFLKDRLVDKSSEKR